MNRMFNPPPSFVACSHTTEKMIFSFCFFQMIFYFSIFQSSSTMISSQEQISHQSIAKTNPFRKMILHPVFLIESCLCYCWNSHEHEHFQLFKSKTFLHIISAPLICSRNDSVWSIVFCSVFPFLIAILHLNDSVCFVFNRKVFVISVVHLTESEGVSWISNGSNVPVSIFTFHYNHEIHSSKFVCILNKSLFFVISWESVVSNRSFIIRREFWFFSLCIFCTYWIFYCSSLCIVKPNSFRFFSWISFISFLSSLFVIESSLCFFSYFAFTALTSSSLRYSWTSHSWEFFMISSWICPTLWTSLWNHCAS